MARKKKITMETPTELPEPENEPTVQETPSIGLMTPETTKVNKSQLVRDTVRQFPHMKPKEIREYILNNHQVDITTNMISTLKSGSGRDNKQPGKLRENKGSNLSVADLVSLKELAQRIGGEELRRVLEVLGD